jgi:hypothetical protein
MTTSIAASAAALCASIVLSLIRIFLIVDMGIVVGEAFSIPLLVVMLLLGVCGRRGRGRRSLGIHGRREVCRLCFDVHQ